MLSSVLSIHFSLDTQSLYVVSWVVCLFCVVFWGVFCFVLFFFFFFSFLCLFKKNVVLHIFGNIAHDQLCGWYILFTSGFTERDREKKDSSLTNAKRDSVT